MFQRSTPHQCSLIGPRPDTWYHRINTHGLALTGASGIQQNDINVSRHAQNEPLPICAALRRLPVLKKYLTDQIFRLIVHAALLTLLRVALPPARKTICVNPKAICKLKCTKWRLVVKIWRSLLKFQEKEIQYHTRYVRTTDNKQQKNKQQKNKQQKNKQQNFKSATI